MEEEINKVLDDLQGLVTNRESCATVVRATKLILALKYNKQPTGEKPLCEARVYKGVGKTEQCKRTAAFDTNVCFSHINWEK